MCNLARSARIKSDKRIVSLIFMKSWTVFLFLSIALLPAAVAKKDAADYSATYAGGSLPLNHNKVRAALGKDEVVFMQGSRRIAVPVRNIREISCGTEVRRRMGAWVLDVVPLMHLGESETHYVGVGWTGGGGTTPRTQVLLKLNRGDYRDFLTALEQATGIKAVNTYQVPTVVHYRI